MFGKYGFKGANKRSDTYYCEMQRIQKYEYIFVNYMRTYMYVQCGNRQIFESDFRKN